MIQLTDTLEQLTPLTNGERIQRYYHKLTHHVLDGELTEPMQDYRQRVAHGIAYQRALQAGDPGRVTGIYGELEDAPRDNVTSITRATA